MKLTGNELLVQRLCRGLGICLNDDECKRVLDAAPDVEAMAYAVLRDDGFDHPEYVSRQLKRAVREIIAAHLP